MDKNSRSTASAHPRRMSFEEHHEMMLRRLMATIPASGAPQLAPEIKAAAASHMTDILISRVKMARSASTIAAHTGA